MGLRCGSLIQCSPCGGRPGDRTSMMLAEVPPGLMTVMSPALPGALVAPENRVTTASPGCRGPCCARAGDVGKSRATSGSSRAVSAAGRRLPSPRACDTRTANRKPSGRTKGLPAVATPSTVATLCHYCSNGKARRPPAARYTLILALLSGSSGPQVADDGTDDVGIVIGPYPLPGIRPDRDPLAVAYQGTEIRVLAGRRNHCGLVLMGLRINLFGRVETCQQAIRVGDAGDHRDELHVAAGHVQRDDTLRLELAQIERHRFPGHQVDRHHVGGEGIEQDHVVASIRRVAERQPGVAEHDRHVGCAC